MKKLLSIFLVTTSLTVSHFQTQAAEVTITATEVWRLRQECEKIALSFSEQIMKSKSHPTAQISLTGYTSHYNIKDNRCYIKIEYSKYYPKQDKIDNLEELYDVQTEEELANTRYSPNNSGGNIFDGFVKYEEFLSNEADRHTQAESYIKTKMSQ
ncbi:MAG: hypothetical protein WAN43_05935 [Rhodomicrobium sp.]